MTQEEDYLTLPQRIADIFNTCSEEEQQYLIQILEELSDTGTSPTYDTLFLQDYIEIPVDVDTFLSDNRYLGIANDGGKSVYPYWRDAMHKIYDDPLQYDEVVFTGATRIGKSSTGVAAAAYCLYRMMCLRNPQRFFKKKDISVFTMLFFNITLDLAKGVGFKEFNDLLKSSPWFQDHGTFSNSKIPVYQPYGDKIVIEAGSEYNHALGQQVFCLVGDTKIRQNDGSYLKLSEYVNNYIPCQSITDAGDIIDSEGFVRLTKMTHDTIKLTLEDGSVIEGTPEHKVKLLSGEYKQLKDLTCSDELYEP